MMTKETQIVELSNLPHILVIDDDKRIRSLILRFLQENDFVSIGAADAFEAADLMRMFEFDAIILDVMMPNISGFDFLSEIRVHSQIPVLMLTALGESEDRIKGLECGADDYLAKPFEPKELILRLKSILKRAKKFENTHHQSYKIGKWIYNPLYDELKNDAEIIRLTFVEANLLRALINNNGEVMSRENLALACNLDTGERTIDVQVTRLRKKIEENSKTPRYLLTLRGKGYMLRADRME